MRRDTQLPSIFASDNICALDGYLLRDTVTPSRTVGSSWRSTRLSAMKTRVLSLRLNGDIYSFQATRNVVGYSEIQSMPLLEPCKPRIVAVRRLATTGQTLTLLLVDEQNGKTIAVIGDTIAWELDGLDVCLKAGPKHDGVLL